MLNKSTATLVVVACLLATLCLVQNANAQFDNGPCDFGPDVISFGNDRSPIIPYRDNQLLTLQPVTVQLCDPWLDLINYDGGILKNSSCLSTTTNGTLNLNDGGSYSGYSQGSITISGYSQGSITIIDFTPITPTIGNIWSSLFASAYADGSTVYISSAILPGVIRTESGFETIQLDVTDVMKDILSGNPYIAQPYDDVTARWIGASGIDLTPPTDDDCACCCGSLSFGEGASGGYAMPVAGVPEPSMLSLLTALLLGLAATNRRNRFRPGR